MAVGLIDRLMGKQRERKQAKVRTVAELIRASVQGEAIDDDVMLDAILAAGVSPNDVAKQIEQGKESLALIALAKTLPEATKRREAVENELKQLNDELREHQRRITALVAERAEQLPALVKAVNRAQRAVTQLRTTHRPLVDQAALDALDARERELGRRKHGLTAKTEDTFPGNLPTMRKALAVFEREAERVEAEVEKRGRSATQAHIDAHNAAENKVDRIEADIQRSEAEAAKIDKSIADINAEREKIFQGVLGNA